MIKPKGHFSIWFFDQALHFPYYIIIIIIFYYSY